MKEHQTKLQILSMTAIATALSTALLSGCASYSESPEHDAAPDILTTIATGITSETGWQIAQEKSQRWVLATSNNGLSLIHI